MEFYYILLIIVFCYMCIIFPCHVRRYRRRKQLRLQAQRFEPTIDASTHPNQNSTIVTHQRDRLVFDFYHTSTESHRDDETAAARHLEAEHRQQIIDIQREIEQEAIRRRNERDQVAEYSQQIIDMQREIEQQAVRRREERRPDAYTPHMPPRLINSSTIRSSIYTITSDSINSSPSYYPHAPPLTPDKSNFQNDDLPSYDQAIALSSITTQTTTSVTVRRF